MDMFAVDSDNKNYIETNVFVPSCCLTTRTSGCQNSNALNSAKCLKTLAISNDINHKTENSPQNMNSDLKDIPIMNDLDQIDHWQYTGSINGIKMTDDQTIPRISNTNVVVYGDETFEVSNDNNIHGNSDSAKSTLYDPQTIKYPMEEGKNFSRYAACYDNNVHQDFYQYMDSISYMNDVPNHKQQQQSSSSTTTSTTNNTTATTTTTTAYDDTLYYPPSIRKRTSSSTPPNNFYKNVKVPSYPPSLTTNTNTTLTNNMTGIDYNYYCHYNSASFDKQSSQEYFPSAMMPAADEEVYECHIPSWSNVAVNINQQQKSKKSGLDEQMEANLIRIQEQHLNVMRSMNWRNTEVMETTISAESEDISSSSEQDGIKRGKPSSVELRRYKESESKKYREFKDKQRQQQVLRNRDRQIKMKINIAMSDGTPITSTTPNSGSSSSTSGSDNAGGIGKIVVESDKDDLTNNEDIEWRRMQQRAINKKNLEIAELYRRKENALELQYNNCRIEDKNNNDTDIMYSSGNSTAVEPNWWLKNTRYSGGTSGKGYSNGPYRNSWIADWRVRGRDFLPRESDDGLHEVNSDNCRHSLVESYCIKEDQNAIVPGVNMLLASGGLYY